MNIRKIFVLLIFALSPILNLQAQEESRLIDLTKLEIYKQKILSPNVRERMVAASYLRFVSANQIGASLMNGIIDLLMKEEDRLNKIRKEKGLSEGTIIGEDPTSGEDGAVYFLDLCEIVGKSGNLKMLPLLIRYATRGKALVGYGEEAVEYFFEGIRKSANKPHYLGYFLSVLGYWLENKKEGYNAQEPIRDQIKAELIKHALSDKEYVVRFSAVMALRKASDDDLIPVLEKIAADDPWHFEEGLKSPTDKNPAPGKKALRYPLREIAQNELAKRKK